MKSTKTALLPILQIAALALLTTAAGTIMTFLIWQGYMDELPNKIICLLLFATSSLIVVLWDYQQRLKRGERKQTVRRQTLCGALLLALEAVILGYALFSM